MRKKEAVYVKKGMALLLALLMLAVTVPMGAVSAATAGTYNGITYQIEGGEVTLTGYTSSLPTNLTIPSTIAGYPVTTIGYGAFEDCSRLRSVVIPDSVIELGTYAFAWCPFLHTVTVGDGVTNTSYGTFSYSGVSTVTFGKGLRDFSDYTFMSCGSLTDVNVAADNPYYCSVDGVLFDKPVARLLYYPGGRKGAYVFPDTCTSYVAGAFDFCDGITEVTLPKGITKIEEGSFYYCKKLTAFYVAEDNPALCSQDGVVFSKDMSTLVICPSGKRGDYVIPDGVTTLDNRAFERCSYVTAITIPDSVTTIRGSAFSYCYSLTAITIPDSVTQIGNHLFYDCKNLVSATVGDGITRLSDMTFYECVKLKTIRLPDHLTYIGYKALWNTAYYTTAANWQNGVLYFGNYLIDSLSTLTGTCTVRDGTTLIAQYAFHDCAQLSGIVIPEGVTAIEFSTFGGCEALTTAHLPRSLTYVGEYAFYSTILTDVYYGGTEQDKRNIDIDVYNMPLHNATWHYTAPVMPGDLDGNGKLNNRDLGLFQRHLNGMDVVIDDRAADLDGNGKLNNRDLGLLQQLLNQ